MGHGARVFTVKEGWGWLCVAAEHWNAERLGWHVCKLGTCFAALEPITQGLMATAASVAADAAGVWPCGWTTAASTCRTISESAETLGHQPQLRLYRTTPDQWRAERFIRTLKEQVIHGRVFQNLRKVREAARRFVDTYNREWLVGKHGFNSPWQARAQWLVYNSITWAA